MALTSISNLFVHHLEQNCSKEGRVYIPRRSTLLGSPHSAFELAHLNSNLGNFALNLRETLDLGTSSLCQTRALTDSFIESLNIRLNF